MEQEVFPRISLMYEKNKAFVEKTVMMIILYQFVLNSQVIRIL